MSASPASYLVEVGPAAPAAEGRPEVGPEYRVRSHKSGPPTIPGIATLADLFNASVAKYGDNNCLGKRTADGFSWRTYRQTAEEVAAVGSALVHRGLAPHGRVGVYGPNCPEWMITMQACNRQAFYCVPLYDTLGEAAVEYILRHAEVTAVAVLGSKLADLAKALPEVKDQVQTVVYWDKADAAVVKKVTDLGITVYDFDSLVKLGKENPAPAATVAPEDLCTIMYTSGTTGDPKGVMLSHHSMVSTVLSLSAFLKTAGVPMGETDSLLSFLPLAHIFDRAAEELMLHVGGAIGYWAGNVKNLLGDVGALRPTLFCSVPRVFDRIFATVTGQVAGGGWLKRTLFNHAFESKLARLRTGVPQDKATPFWDRIVFKKIKAALGGRCRVLVSGGAPLSKKVEEFLRVTMGSLVVQGYGLTETCAASFIAYPSEPDHMGTVGPPQPVISLRLEGVPEMNYSPSADPPRGEVCLRGPAVFDGYYKDPSKTAEVMNSDGWFYTGDIGELTSTGALRIIDRKKNIFKLSQGEYVAVEKIENVYKLCPAVEQVWVYGNSLESCLVGVVVPTAARVEAFKHGASIEEACANPAFKKEVLAELGAVAKAGKLKGFEQVRALLMEPVAFSVENEMLTPTFKLKRPQLLTHYKTQIDGLYKDINGA